VNYRKTGILCQGNIHSEMRGAVTMFVVGRELCLLRIEVLHFRRSWLFVDSRKIYSKC